MTWWFLPTVHKGLFEDCKTFYQLPSEKNYFYFDVECLKFFSTTKDKSVTEHVITAPYWEILFDLMCDVSDDTIIVVLCQKCEKIFHVIYYATKFLIKNQEKYTTTEKELLVVIFELEFFWEYLIGSEDVIFTDHATLKYIYNKGDSKSRLLW